VKKTGYLLLWAPAKKLPQAWAIAASGVMGGWWGVPSWMRAAILTFLVWAYGLPAFM
jgi:hypothetical protein